MSIHPLHRSGQMTAVTWRELLARAHSDREVVSVARDYIAHFDYRELDDLPEPCKPPKFMNGGDVAAYAFELKSHDCERSDKGVVIQQLSEFFSEASNRLAQVAAIQREGPSQDDDRESA